MITKCVVMCPEGKLDILDKFKMFKVEYVSYDCTSASASLSLS